MSHSGSDKTTRVQFAFTAIHELDLAITNHDTWLRSLLRILICSESPDPAFSNYDAHRNCAFGTP